MWSDHQKGRRLHNCKGITDKKFTTLGQHDTFAKFRRQRLLENTDFCNPDLSMKERKIIFQIIVCSFPQCILMYYCCMVHSEYCMVWILMPVMCKMRTQVIFFCQTSFVLWIILQISLGSIHWIQLPYSRRNEIYIHSTSQSHSHIWNWENKNNILLF